MSTLATETAKFRQWAVFRQSPNFQPSQYSHGAEWECDYPEWQRLYSALDDFIATAADRRLTSAELEILLYVLARDNEDERVLERLEQFPSIAAQVVDAAVGFSDVEARWQAAVLAGRIASVAGVRQFLEDEAEYVRRRAGFALQELESRA